MQGYIVSLVIFTGIFALFSLGLNLQWGFTGLINFGHVAFMTIGAYTTVLLSLKGVPLVLAVAIGALLSALLGLLIGFSTLRLREDYLAIVTIGVAEVVRLIVLNEEWLTRGARGIPGYPLPLENFRPTLISKLVMIALLTAIVAYGLWRLWLWTRQCLQRGQYQQTIISAAVVGSYTAATLLLLYGIGVVAHGLKTAKILNPGLLGLLVLAVFVAIVVLAVWVGQQFITKLTDWQQGTMLLTGVVCLVGGLWFYVVGASALYNFDYKAGLMLVLVVTLAILYGLLERLVQSPWGRVLKAIREDEDVARALGKDVFWYKLQSLMIGGAIAGIAGAFYTWQLTFINPDGFTTLITFQAWTIVVVGGAGSNAGTLLGALIFWSYTTLTRFTLEDIVPLDAAQLGAFRIMTIGLILMILMMWRPQGVLGNQDELTLGR
ncbi:MAG: branched-chain amino acid ABC transporter permease [Cyanobacteria bacterium]|nr:branched-chain amino acid ABC transporter permease [Cyanobacteriota bacterium]MDW8200919.1 branched-chain amino acid ABC transporter permease [Cyanobacteriota bacterium SKYGB_h_bin112]